MTLRLLALAFAVAASAMIGLASADPIFPKGSRVGLEPPPGMSLSQRFPGYEDTAKKAAITISELPLRAYESVQQSFFNSAPPGVTIDSREMLPFANGIGFLMTGTVTVNGALLHKWFLLAQAVGGPDFDFVAMINVEVPDTATASYPDKVIRDALSTVTFRPSPTAELMAMLPYKLSELSGFRIMQVIPPGAAIITDGPTSDLTRQPYMIISAGPGSAGSADDRARAARTMLDSVPLQDLRITSTEAMRLSNLPGYEIRATANALGGAPVKLVQWVRFGATGYMRIIGVGPAGDWDRLFDRFRSVRDGIELR